MDYKVLYRKYRPENFENIVGQDLIINTLKNAIKSGKVAHAYLFSGPRGTGKTSTAKVFAKALNCTNYKDEPCNMCESCLNIATSPDIIEIDAASNNGVDDVRELINNVRLAPSISKYKVYIIDEVHMLTTNAFNALLLTLEEPPSNVVFILATTNVESVPITILSRCQRFDFSQISKDELIKRLEYVCENEKIDIDRDAIEEIADLSEGGLRDALGILDQLSSQTSKITLEYVQNSYNIVCNKSMDEILQYFLNNDKKIVDLIDSFELQGYDFRNVAKRIIRVFHNYIIDNFESDENVDKLKNIIFDINKMIGEVNIYVSPYLLLKVLFLSYFKNNDSKVVDEKQPIKEVIIPSKNPDNELVERKKEEKKYFPGNIESDNFKKVRVNNTFATADKKVLQLVSKEWDEFKRKIKNDNLLSLLVDTNIVVASDNYAIICTDIEATSHLVNASISVIEKDFNKKYKRNIKFVSIFEEEWKTLKNEYINNKKKNIPYEIVEEEKLEYNVSELKQIADEVFDLDKIEME